MKLNPGNIWSGNPWLAVFTNPTELAFHKRNLKSHYPITYEGKTYPDAEAAYQDHTRDCKAGMELCKSILIDILIQKLEQYPAITGAIMESGGLDWIEKCSHMVGAQTKTFKRWEGHGLKSPFIECLYRAFAIVEDDWQEYMRLEEAQAYQEMTLPCRNCGKDVHLDISRSEFKNGKGYHIRANCTECKKFIKFISH